MVEPAVDRAGSLFFPKTLLVNQLPVLLKEVKGCTVCKAHLPLGPRPILSAHRSARIVVIGQAPGKRVHESGVPWDDLSGNRLREWMGISEREFYDKTKIALVPMGFCYPGTGKSGDLPPRKECAELWHETLLMSMPKVELTLLLGQYAHAYYLGDQRKDSLTETVKTWKEYLPEYLPLPHPSPRNNIWLKKNPWFAKSLIPGLRSRVSEILK